MRIVCVNNYAHVTGGADQHCFGLTSVLRERGHDVAYLATRGENDVDDQGVFIPCRVSHSTRDSLSPVDQSRAFLRAMWNHDAAAAMDKLLDEFRPDVVHAHKLYPQLSVAPLVVAARRGVPVVQTLHDFELVSASALDVRGGWIDSDETRLRYRFLNAATLPVRRRVHVPRVSAFIAVSRFVARIYASHGIEAEVLPNFASLDLDASANGFGSRNGILFFGRLRPEKGVLDVLEMAERLPEVTVTIAGSGALEDVVRVAADRLPNLHALGYVPGDQLRAILRNARVVVIPSRCQDAGPLVPLEAFAAATPVVAYANGGLAEYVIDSGGGRVVPADSAALAAVAAELHEDEASWASHSQRASAAIRERHSPEGYADRVLEIYDRVRSEPLA